MRLESGLDPLRLRECNQAPVNQDGRYVLYWMTSARRPHWNRGLQRALDWSRQLGCRLVIFEALRCDYRWASQRTHAFIAEGMLDNGRVFDDAGAAYFPFIERETGHGKGLLEALAAHAKVVVTDEFPCFFLPEMVNRVSERLKVKLEAVDDNGIVPMRATEKTFLTAYSFRRFLQKTLMEYVYQWPDADPLGRQTEEGLRGNRAQRLEGCGVERQILERWEPAFEIGAETAPVMKTLSYGTKVGPASISGGWSTAERRADLFVEQHLDHYGTKRNQPDEVDDGTSGLSPYFHFGHISSAQVLDTILRKYQWQVHPGLDRTDGRREGWWGLPPGVESFLDQLVTWRELGYNMCLTRPDYADYSSLPEWAQTTLDAHAGDERPFLYTREEFEAGKTHDALWNAAQQQLVQEGRMHNYLRMLWAKKVLHWSASPQEALETLIHLNNQYALDGRNPNSYSGIFWTFGRYDRPWGPEREVFGRIRYMTSASTMRKLRVKKYMARYGAGQLSF